MIKCANTATDFSPSEKARCLKAIDAANKDVAARRQEHVSNPKQAMTKPFAVDWELLNNLQYESGPPHTRGAVCMVRVS